MKFYIYRIYLVTILSGVYLYSYDFTKDYDKFYYNFSEYYNTPIGIVCLAYNRPDYFTQVISCYEKTPQALYMPFFFMIDGGPEAKQEELIQIINSSSIVNKYIILRKKNLGCARSIIDARRFMFEWCKFKKILVFEDDLLISPEYITLTLRLHAWAQKNFDNIGIVQATNSCFLSREQKLQKLNCVQETFGDFWGYCLDFQAYEKIKDILNEYEKEFLVGIPREYPNKYALIRWSKHLLDTVIPKTYERNFICNTDYKEMLERRIQNNFKRADSRYDGQDLETRMALYLAGLIKVTTLVNRSLYIGKEGVHHTNIDWEKNAFGKITLDIFSTDKDLKNFIPIYQEPTRKKIACIIGDHDLGGVQIITKILKYFVCNGHEVKIVCSEAIKNKMINFSEIRNSRLKKMFVPEIIDYWKYDIFFYPYFNISQEEIDIINLENDFAQIFAGPRRISKEYSRKIAHVCDKIILCKECDSEIYLQEGYSDENIFFITSKAEGIEKIIV